MSNDDVEIQMLSKAIRACRICVEAPLKTPLPHDPVPICVLSSTARICICSQAPGMRAHKSAKPFADPSGDRLRDWMGIDKETFYDPARLAIAPMGFCFPGYDAKGGDLPPRRECRPAWHQQVFAAMNQLKLIIAVGGYAQAYHLGEQRGKNLTETVRSWRHYERRNSGPDILPLPHPSWRNNGWLKRNPWFEEELLPVLRKKVSQYM